MKDQQTSEATQPTPAPTAAGAQPGRHREARRTELLSSRNRMLLAGGLLLLVLCVAVPLAATAIAAEPADEPATDLTKAEAILAATRSTSPAEGAGSDGVLPGGESVEAPDGVSEGTSEKDVATPKPDGVTPAEDPGQTTSKDGGGSVAVWLGVGAAVAAFCLVMVRDREERS
ncbi:hypothetical protein FXB39_21090 [Nocardioides sp. BGMRC 2183]|nr:hypothetical protein FXB39_21090 [Nocardioides sp. BGMRC 2183]